MILKASAENGSSSVGWRSIGLSCSSWPLMAGTSTGEGRYSITASSMACTPRFLKALPASIGTISLRMVRARRPCLISASVKASPFRYLSSSSGEPSAAASTMWSCHFCASSFKSAGISS
ncbi:hypothetical protein D3C86_1739640 [compost metagenome]